MHILIIAASSTIPEVQITWKLLLSISAYKFELQFLKCPLSWLFCLVKLNSAECDGMGSRDNGYNGYNGG
jgi:hypothetical protein